MVVSNMNSAGAKVKRIWKGFLSDTSLHGCHYLTHGNKHVVSRVFWFLSVIAYITLLVVNLHTLYTTYKQYNYRTKTNIKFVDNLEFPAITLCNSHSFNTIKMNMSSDLYQFLYGKQTIDLVNRSYFSDPKWNTTIITPSDLEKVVLNARDMFVHAHHGRGVLNVSHFQMNYRKPLETCFTYNGQWKQKDLTPIMSNEDDTLVLYVDINQDHYAFTSLTAGMSLCIHPPDEPFDTKTPCTSLSPGHAYEVKLSVHDYTYLADPYNSYQSMDCTTASQSSLKKILKYFYHYSYRGCLMECLTDKILEECGCITEHEIQNASSNYCSVTQREGCVSSVRNKFNTDTLYASNISGLCYCPRPCSNVLYDQDLSASFFPADSLIDYLKAGNFATGLEDARSNLMMIKISFKSLMLTHISHVPDVTLDDLVSRMGGLMGFYIGASVLTLLEVVDVIIRSVSTIIASYFSVEIVNNKVKPELNKTTVKDGMPNKS